jgi:hypothetical protein
MSDAKKIIDEMERQLKVRTADLRPTLQLAVETIQAAMRTVPGGGADPDHLGPDLWTWIDRRGKVYAVAPSPDKDGHPMLTIRQPVTKELGIWITTTVLLLGNDKASILQSATVALVAHTGAFSGYQSTVEAMSRDGDPMDGMRRACEIADRDPTTNSAIAAAIRGADKDKKPEGLN